MASVRSEGEDEGMPGLQRGHPGSPHRRNGAVCSPTAVPIPAAKPGTARAHPRDTPPVASFSSSSSLPTFPPPQLGPHHASCQGSPWEATAGRHAFGTPQGPPAVSGEHSSGTPEASPAGAPPAQHGWGHYVVPWLGGGRGKRKPRKAARKRRTGSLPSQEDATERDTPWEDVTLSSSGQLSHVPAAVPLSPQAAVGDCEGAPVAGNGGGGPRGRGGFGLATTVGPRAQHCSCAKCSASSAVGARPLSGLRRGRSLEYLEGWDATEQQHHHHHQQHQQHHHHHQQHQQQQHLHPLQQQSFQAHHQQHHLPHQQRQHHHHQQHHYQQHLHQQLQQAQSQQHLHQPHLPTPRLPTRARTGMSFSHQRWAGDILTQSRAGARGGLQWARTSGAPGGETVEQWWERKGLQRRHSAHALGAPGPLDGAHADPRQSGAWCCSPHGPSSHAGCGCGPGASLASAPGTPRSASRHSRQLGPGRGNSTVNGTRSACCTRDTPAGSRGSGAGSVREVGTGCSSAWCAQEAAGAGGASGGSSGSGAGSSGEAGMGRSRASSFAAEMDAWMEAEAQRHGEGMSGGGGGGVSGPPTPLPSDIHPSGPEDQTEAESETEAEAEDESEEEAVVVSSSGIGVEAEAEEELEGGGGGIGARSSVHEDEGKGEGAGPTRLMWGQAWAGCESGEEEEEEERGARGREREGPRAGEDTQGFLEPGAVGAGEQSDINGIKGGAETSSFEMEAEQCVGSDEESVLLQFAKMQDPGGTPVHPGIIPVQPGSTLVRHAARRGSPSRAPKQGDGLGQGEWEDWEGGSVVFSEEDLAWDWPSQSEGASLTHGSANSRASSPCSDSEAGSNDGSNSAPQKGSGAELEPESGAWAVFGPRGVPRASQEGGALAAHPGWHPQERLQQWVAQQGLSSPPGAPADSGAPAEYTAGCGCAEGGCNEGCAAGTPPSAPLVWKEHHFCPHCRAAAAHSLSLLNRAPLDPSGLPGVHPIAATGPCGPLGSGGSPRPCDAAPVTAAQGKNKGLGGAAPAVELGVPGAGAGGLVLVGPRNSCASCGSSCQLAGFNSSSSNGGAATDTSYSQDCSCHLSGGPAAHHGEDPYATPLGTESEHEYATWQCPGHTRHLGHPGEAFGYATAGCAAPCCGAVAHGLAQCCTGPARTTPEGVLAVTGRGGAMAVASTSGMAPDLRPEEGRDKEAARKNSLWWSLLEARPFGHLGTLLALHSSTPGAPGSSPARAPQSPSPAAAGALSAYGSAVSGHPQGSSLVYPMLLLLGLCGGLEVAGLFAPVEAPGVPPRPVRPKPAPPQHAARLAKPGQTPLSLLLWSGLGKAQWVVRLLSCIVALKQVGGWLANLVLSRFLHLFQIQGY